MLPGVADLVASPVHAGPLEGAHALGEAAGGARLVVRIGLWLKGSRVERACYRATTCASLIAFAEVACERLEAGVPPGEVDADLLRARLPRIHPTHRDRADLVAAAVRAASRIPKGAST